MKKDYLKQDKETFESNYFKECVKLFIKKSKLDKESRYKSWEYCYNFFHKVYKKHKLEKCFGDNENWTYKDQLSLHLAFYMASWGMYRGSSFLLQNDYKIYYGVVDVIFNKKYDSLWNDDSLFAEDRCKMITNLYMDIFNKLKDYKEYFLNKSKFQKDTKEAMPDRFLTIITKIILGTIGCFPALDRNFKYAFGISDPNVDRYKEAEDAVKIIISRVYNLASNLVKNKNLLEDKKLKKVFDKQAYPFMKLLDMYYFIKGQEDFFLHNLGFKKEKFKNAISFDIPSSDISTAIKNALEAIEDKTIENKTKAKEAGKFLYNIICKEDIYVANKEIKEAWSEIENDICNGKGIENIETLINKAYKEDEEE